MKHRVRVRDRVRYAVDNSLAHGSVAIIAWLFVFSAVIVVFAGAVATAARIAPAGEEPLCFAEAAWSSLVRTLDPGTMGGDTGWGFRWLMLVVTLGGIFVISTLIGAITSGIEARLDKLRKGRSQVIETDHTVILGWTPQVFTVLEELAEANRNRRQPRIAILAEADKVAMDDEIRAKVPDLHNTRAICRTGSPIEPNDLDIVSLNTARSIIVLSGERTDTDAEVIRTILAITRHPRRRDEPYRIVAAIRDGKNLAAAVLAGGDEAACVVVGDLVARIIAQTCRQAGLSTVYTELLNFKGDEIYFVPATELAGGTFGEALAAFEDSTVIGVHQKDADVRIGPPMDTPIGAADDIIVITADDDTARVNGRAANPVDETAIRVRTAPAPRPERTLILGWNWRGPAIVRELDNYVPSGSVVRIVASCEVGAAERAACCPGILHQTVDFQQADTTDRAVLDGLGPADVDHVIVLNDACEADTAAADARTLVTLLHLRDIAAKTGARFSIVTEVVDARNERLADVVKVDDFIVSDRIVSQMLAQVSENRYLNPVFADLFDPGGCEIYLKSAADYVAPGHPVTFYTVLEAARRRGEIAIGYRLIASDCTSALGHGVFINPRKSATVTFGEADRIIVLAED